MFVAARRQMRSIAVIGVASALTVGGVAVAQGGGDGDVQPAKRPMHGAVAMGSGMSSLTYAELRAPRAGGDETIRVGQGAVESADKSSVLPRHGDVVRAVRGNHMPPPSGPPLRLQMAAPR